MSNESAKDLMKQGYSFKNLGIIEDMRFYWSKEGCFECTKYNKTYASYMLEKLRTDWSIGQRHIHLND